MYVRKIVFFSIDDKFNLEVSSLKNRIFTAQLTSTHSMP